MQKLTPEVHIDWSLNLTTKPTAIADGTPKPGQPLAASTKHRTIVTVKAVMAHAVRMRWVNYDPTANRDAPA
ncbi:hypothetical protein [Millisia brevis]|uniref:hypothetical protein n=1 Tax=Millisia brevis TaxID=264148 RepID=UPI001FE11645|nr:hypothetical protein [Millisia brevis]